MAFLTIKDFPDDLHRKAKSEAALEGISKWLKIGLNTKKRISGDQPGTCIRAMWKTILIL